LPKDETPATIKWSGVPYPGVLPRPKAVCDRGRSGELQTHNRSKPLKNQPVSLASLQRSLSSERLQAYATPEDSDSLDAVARYVWDLALGAAIQPVLHVLEITFRNHVFEASRKLVDESALRFHDMECWLDADPSLLEERELAAVLDAKNALLRSKRPLTPGRLVAKLGFGFWVSLCKRPYEQGRVTGPGLWPGLISHAFPFAPKQYRTRSSIFHRVDGIRELRNRVSHHEPVWDRNVLQLHGEILETIGWMNQGLATALEPISPLFSVHRGGHARYRELAQRLVRVD